jgi:hypothetical protein
MSKLELTRLCRTRDDGPLPGDPCPCEGCEGKIGVYKKKSCGGFAFRYLWCMVCKHRPKNNKWITAEDTM